MSINRRRMRGSAVSSINLIISSLGSRDKQVRYNFTAMIPIHLRISGFLSYRDPVDLNFNLFDLACISGRNGSGKSSLLDAITWCLFGQARKHDESVINLGSKVADVALIFEYEGNIFRVQRTLPRGKSSLLEFQIREPGIDNRDLKMNPDRQISDNGNWKALTERTQRETQVRIESILRLDYDTFVNASFFLQGKADLFTQQTASKRKDVLSSILGLEIWETYKERTSEKRKSLEREVDEIDGRIAEIDAELAEEHQRKARLAELESGLKQLASSRAMQESAVEIIKKTAASLEQQRKLVAALLKSLERSRTNLMGLQARLAEKQSQRTRYVDLVKRAKEIESAYKAWQKARLELEQWDKIAARFLDQDKLRAPLLEHIASQKVRLEEEQRGLLIEQQEIKNQSGSIGSLKSEIAGSQKLLADAEEKMNERPEVEALVNTARVKQAELKTENDRLKIEMEELKARIERLKLTDGAVCPLCDQPLTEAHRLSTLEGLEKDGKNKAIRYRSNQIEAKALVQQITDYGSRITRLASAEQDRLTHSNFVSQLSERLLILQSRAKEWESRDEKRLIEVSKLLQAEKYASEARQELIKLDKNLAKLGYDAAAHDAVRQSEFRARSTEEEYANLNSAREVNKQIEDEISNLKAEIKKRESEILSQEAEHLTAATALDAAESQAPDLEQGEHELLELREQENQARDEFGAARQKVEILGTLRVRKTSYAAQREEYQKQIGRYRTLERAFGKDGVPALLIEQALPQIESKANELLDRLSEGQMSIRFITQAGYKDRKRDDLRETLDIQISDAAGIRDYEMFSGGEAFRVNFAIRLALSEILAQRKGARLQTLVIDEGFGSQDVQGRQRLIEAINLVKNDFAKILVITHLEELKDAFPTRIEIEKNECGSTLTVF
jgi:exonuclease SbcC